MKKRGKKAELNLSFNMIFSIILIVAFIAAAFYGITKFLEFQDTVTIDKFGSDLQDNVDTLRKSSGSEGWEVEYYLPKKITAVCFKDDDYQNLYFESEKIISGMKIEHINIDATLNGEESACFENTDGKVSMILSKDFGDVLVTVSPLE